MAPMDARSRVRQFLARGTADRPPFLAMATEYTARLAQCTVGELLADPGLFVRSFTESVAVLGLEAVLIEIPAAVAVGGDPAASGGAVLREDLHRLRATLRDQLAMAVLLPGPLTLSASLGLPATTDSLDDLVTALITLQEYLGPADLDAFALLEREAVADADVPLLADATAAFWNVARYYSLPSLLIAARGTPRLAEAGPTAVAAWSGVTAAELLAGGAAAAGQPPPSGQQLPAGHPAPAGQQPPPAPIAPAPLPPGGFYLTAGEIPVGWPVGAVRSLVRPLPG
jgi:hypothetical protein